MDDWLRDQLHNNDVLTGILGGSMFASGLYLCRHSFNQVWDWLIKRASITFSVSSETEAFNNILDWLAETDYSKKKCRNIKITEGSDDENTGTWIVAPGFGAHHCFYKGKFLRIDREKVENKMHGESEILSLKFFTFNRDIVMEFIKDVIRIRDNKDSIDVYIWDGWWSKITKRVKRHANSVILGKQDKDRILLDLDRFLKSETKSWYEERGIPYKRGYLFYGKPGTGKTSMLTVMASKFNLNIRIINLSTVSNDNDLLQALLRIPARSLLVLEDIDIALGKALKKRDTKPSSANDDEICEEETNRITMSGLLNAIDGVVSAEGRILVMTTNNKDKLDAALIRSGRIDLQIEFELADRSVASLLFKQFYGEVMIVEDEFLDTIIFPIAHAELQGMFMEHPYNPERLLVDKSSSCP